MATQPPLKPEPSCHSGTMRPTEGRRQMNVLSIDGGGMRGIYSASYLAQLAHHYAQKRGVVGLDIGKGFNLIVGTSTGAIIACALAAGVPLDQVVDLYRKHGRQIFPARVPKSYWQAIMRGPRWSGCLTKGAKALQTALIDVFKEKTLGDILQEREVALAIPATEMSGHRPTVFKTSHLPDSFGKHDHYKISDVCLATTAAPIYRSLASIPDPSGGVDRIFADGGLWANNPTLVGLIDALELTKHGDQIRVFSLGTCPRPSGKSSLAGNLNLGIIDWRFGADITPLSIDAQNYAFDNIARMLSRHVYRDCKVVRFPHGEVSADLMQYLDLDETRDIALEALIGKAQDDVSETLSQCSDSSNSEGQMLDSLFSTLPPLMETHT